MVNNGKNIAIGGSITEITQAKVLYIPSTKYYVTIMVLFIIISKFISLSSKENNILANNSDGTFAPSIVIHKIKVSIKSIIGIPIDLEVNILSIFCCFNILFLFFINSIFLLFLHIVYRYQTQLYLSLYCFPFL